MVMIARKLAKLDMKLSLHVVGKAVAARVIEPSPYGPKGASLRS
jgi:glycine cleavage system aminomethyltransferase T